MRIRYFIVPLALCIGFLSISCKGDDQPGDPDITIKDIPEVDNAVAGFMTSFNIPGVQVAITKNGKLVYSKAYGKADDTQEGSVKLTSLFRVASVAKPVTGIAIMKLIEEGKLTLDQKVFGAGNLLGTTYGNASAQVSLITVRHLLQHTAGGWGNSVNDPMFLQPALNENQIITWTLANRSLTNTPGTRYDYSNFGYCVLGRVIEKVTGQTYEAYVKASILAPLGITQMSVGGNTLAERKTNEVVYYGQGGENPYLYNIKRMDAHGGWIANASDLARLLVAVDGFSTKPDILKPASVTEMTTASAANANYANGWSVNSVGNWWHAGSLPGTATQIVRTSGGYCWVVLCNTRTSGAAFSSALDGLIWKAVNNTATQWPDYDLFR